MSNNEVQDRQNVDVTIIGAGIVGLATGRALLLRYPNLRLTILEKESKIGQHQTGNNSGVIHSGLYYTPGSLKAKLCVSGAEAMMRYCDEHNIPYKLCGKVVVATDESELPRLEELYRRGIANNVPGLEMIGPERLREIEPNAAGIKAIYSPNTGIVDFGLVAASFADDIRKMGGEIRTNSQALSITRKNDLVYIETPSGTVATRYVVACAGLHADRVAELTGGSPTPRIVPFRGDYYVLKPERAHLVNALIYPVPDPAFPFLGIHSTLRMNGEMWIGPNAVLAFSREGYKRTDFNFRDLWDALSYSGFRALAFKFWRVGLAEMIRDYNKFLFVKATQKLIPAITMDDVVPGHGGVRAQALTPDGKMVDDFVIDVDGPIVHVRNAPSPAATSSLSIAETIADRASEAFGLAKTA